MSSLTATKNLYQTRKIRGFACVVVEITKWYLCTYKEDEQFFINKCYTKFHRNHNLQHFQIFRLIYSFFRFFFLHFSENLNYKSDRHAKFPLYNAFFTMFYAIICSVLKNSCKIQFHFSILKQLHENRKSEYFWNSSLKFLLYKNLFLFLFVFIALCEHLHFKNNAYVKYKVTDIII